MKKIFFLVIFSSIFINGCTVEKEYSVKELVKEWDEIGPTAPLVVEVKKACAEHEAKGEKGSKVCNVLHQAQAELASKSLESGSNGGISF